jgi:flavin-dependent dehydrogenase
LKDSIKVGLGGVTENFKKDSKKILKEFLGQDVIRDKVGEGEIIGFEAHMIPMKGPHMNLASDRLLICGDAGGFVFPGTGEGVYYAIKSGRIAAEVADFSLKNDNHNMEFLSKCYEENLERNGLISLRDVDFVENVLSCSENAEKYVLKLRNLAAK